MAIMLQCLLTGQLVQGRLTRKILNELNCLRMLGTEENPGIMFQTLKELFLKMQDFL
jgi:hypothetical protein